MKATKLLHNLRQSLWLAPVKKCSSKTTESLSYETANHS